MGSQVLAEPVDPLMDGIGAAVEDRCDLIDAEPLPREQLQQLPFPVPEPLGGLGDKITGCNSIGGVRAVGEGSEAHQSIGEPLPSGVIPPPVSNGVPSDPVEPGQLRSVVHPRNMLPGDGEDLGDDVADLIRR